MIVVLVLMSLVAGAGILAGGSLRALAETRFRATWLLLGAFALQLLLDFSDAAPRNTGALLILLASIGAVTAFLVANRHLPGIAMACVGLALNLAVIGANGAMPVSAHAAEVAGASDSLKAPGVKHERLDEDSRLALLGDVIPLPGLKSILSVGDVLLALGLAHLVLARTTSGRQTMHTPQRAVE